MHKLAIVCTTLHHKEARAPSSMVEDTEQYTISCRRDELALSSASRGYTWENPATADNNQHKRLPSFCELNLSAWVRIGGRGARTTGI